MRASINGCTPHKSSSCWGLEGDFLLIKAYFQWGPSSTSGVPGVRHCSAEKPSSSAPAASGPVLMSSLEPVELGGRRWRYAWNLFTSGLLVVYLWFTYSLLAVYLWFTCDFLTIYFRFTFGLLSVYSRFTYGLLMVYWSLLTMVIMDYSYWCDEPLAFDAPAVSARPTSCFFLWGFGGLNTRLKGSVQKWGHPKERTWWFSSVFGMFYVYLRPIQQWFTVAIVFPLAIL